MSCNACQHRATPQGQDDGQASQRGACVLPHAQKHDQVCVVAGFREVRKRNSARVTNPSDPTSRFHHMSA
eukprot:5960840-Amphidinium_carterae.1